MYSGYLTDIEGILVGHAEDQTAITGCTVILFENRVVAGIDIRGSAPGSRETALLNPTMLMDGIDGLLLTGGSAFGLDAAAGIMAYLEEKGKGFDTGICRIPIVPALVLFDLGIGDYKGRPDKEMGYLACCNASSEERRQGNVGVGLGATVGKYMGMKHMMKGGLGSATLQHGDLMVSALVAVNAVGDVYDSTGKKIAGTYDYKNKSLLTDVQLLNTSTSPLMNTTIGVIATNGILNKTEATKVAQMAHDGLARSISPVHTMQDGDAVFTVSTGTVMADVNVVGIMAAQVMSLAIVNGIKQAQTVDNVISCRDVKGGWYHASGD